MIRKIIFSLFVLVLITATVKAQQMTISTTYLSACNGSVIKIRLNSFSGVSWPIDFVQKREFNNGVWGAWTNVSTSLGYDGISNFWNVTLTAKTEYRLKEPVSGGTLYSNVISVDNQYKPRLLLWGQDSGTQASFMSSDQGSSLDFSLNLQGATNATVTWYKNNVQVTNSPLNLIPNTHSYRYYGSVFETWKAYVYNNQSPGACGAFTNEITIQPKPHVRIGTNSNSVVSSGEITKIDILSYYGSFNWYDVRLEKRDFVNGSWTNWTDSNVSPTYTGYSLYFNYAVSRKSKYRAYVSVSGGRIESEIIEFDVINSITTFVPTVPLTNENTLNSQSAENVIKTTNYFDGLGRVIQSVNWQATPNKKDLIQPFMYDGFGREINQYLPITVNSNSGWYKPGLLNANGSLAGDANAFYSNGTSDKITDDTAPYAKTVYDNSPLSRVIKQSSPGSVWQPDGNNSYSSSDKTRKFSYEYNLNQEVLLWTYSYPSASNPLGLINAGSNSNLNFYSINQLYKNKTKDENQNEVIEYKDKENRVILKKVQVSGNIYAYTYYIYDDFGSLVCVLPPEAVSRLNTEYFIDGITDNGKNDFLKRWAFRYNYDERKRIIIKQIPGAELIYYVYDVRDRLVLSQDGNQRVQNKWSYFKYDRLNRPIITGIYTHPTSITQSDIKLLISSSSFFETYNGDNATHGYTNTASYFPSNNVHVLTVTYYDNYNFILPLVNGGNNSISTYNYQINDLPGQYVYGPIGSQNNFPNVRGQITGTKTNILNSTNYLYSISYYDDRYRLVQNISQNHKSGIDRITNKYDFSGKVTETMRTYVVSGTTHQIKESFTYDHANRLLTVKHNTNNTGDILLVKNEYNELGQLVDKKLHATSADNFNSFKQSIDYRYNIRGWLTSINNSKLNNTTNNDDLNDLFGMELGYESDLGLGANPQYNGNIAAIKWSNNTIQSNVLQRGYAFSYDAMSRLLNANQKQAIVFDNWMAGNYDESITSYDLNGNILGLQRKDGSGNLIDNLSYHYSTGLNASNKLLYINDAADATTGFINGNTNNDDYAYDNNGNLTVDKNKGITAITYNHLNLPTQVNKGNTDYIVYTFDATGRKLAQQVFGSTPKTTDYVGELIFENNALKIINTSEGRILPDGTNWEYQYHLKDHLGNVRSTFSTKQITEQSVATLEPANITSEQVNFLRVAEVRKVQSHLFDRSNGEFPTTTSGFAIRLSGSANERYGLAKSISVMPGDVISTEVYAKYIDQQSSNRTAALNTLLSNIIAGTTAPGTIIDGGSYTNSTNNFPFPIQGSQNTASSNEVGPKAYLNWLVFKRDGTFLLAQSGFDRLSNLPKEQGQDVAHERLFSPDITITEPGFIYIYISNEESSPLEVYFDDFKVTHTSKTPIIQSDDYYPFGLTFNSYKRTNNTPQDFNFNGKEKQDELSLGWLDYGARMYDPSFGKWSALDPVLEKFVSHTPYNYCLGNPVVLIDPDGMTSRYNWGSGSYYDDTNNNQTQDPGEETVPWDNVQSENSLGSYSSPSSAYLSPKKDKGKIPYDSNGALEMILQSAINAGGSMAVLHVEDIEDAINQLSTLPNKINTLIIGSHGYSQKALFKVGNGTKIVGEDGVAAQSENLVRIASYVMSDGAILLTACHAGSLNNGGSKMIETISNVTKLTVYGNMSWTEARTTFFQGSCTASRSQCIPTGYSVDSYPAIDRGFWYRAYYDNKTNSVVHTFVYDLFIDSFGKIRYSK
jgi:RHS repeat-associated protein